MLPIKKLLQNFSGPLKFLQRKNFGGLLALVAVSGIFAGTGLLMLGRAWSKSYHPATIPSPLEGEGEGAIGALTRFIDGVSVDAPDAQDPPLAAVVVDNITEARPQAGITDAPFVWEVPVEGGMTRLVVMNFLPLPEGEIKRGRENTTTTLANLQFGKFANLQIPDRVGPVRSVRPYLLDLASEFHAPLFHVGGSPEAISKIKNGVKTINEFSRGWFFYRDPSRPRPSNVYTNLQLMREAVAHDGLSIGTASGTPWRFSSTATDHSQFGKFANLQIPSVTLAFGAVSVEWRYDPERRAYVRRQNGAPHKDEKGREITAANVIVQEAPVEILDAVGRRKIDLFGEGKATVYRGGEIKEGLWRRPFRNARTRFFDAGGQEIMFAPGATWVEITPAR